MEKKLPFVAFAYSDEIWDFIERKWRGAQYRGYDTWSILVNELYDFTY